MAQIFSRYVPTTVSLVGGEVKLKLYPFDKTEGPAFRDKVRAHFEGVAPVEGESPEAAEKRAGDSMVRWLAFVRETFGAVDSKGRGKYVRLVENLKEDEDDSNEEISTGAQLHARTPGDFHQAVMVKLAGYASLSDTEGKSYGSPSTSTVATGPSTDSPVSPATSTVNAGSLEPSTATPTSASFPFSGAA